jgi:hypothetical protein
MASCQTAWKLSGKERVRIPVKPATPNYGKGSYLKLFENSHWQYPIRKKLIVSDRSIVASQSSGQRFFAHLLELQL